MTYNWCKGPDISLPAPDLVLFLSVPPTVAKGRGGYGAERYETEALQERVREVFLSIHGDTTYSNRELLWKNVDASGDIGAVENTIWGIVEPFSQGMSGGIERLWS